mgnify:CR=1 FL=1
MCSPDMISCSDVTCILVPLQSFGGFKFLNNITTHPTFKSDDTQILGHFQQQNEMESYHKWLLDSYQMQPSEMESYLKWLLDSWFECLNQLTHLAIFSSEMKWSHTISGFWIWILLINLLYLSYPIVIVQKIKCNYLFKLFRWVK